MRKAKRKPLSGCVGQLHFSFFRIDRRMCVRSISVDYEADISELIYCTAASCVLTRSLTIGFYLLPFLLSYYVISQFYLIFFIMEISNCSATLKWLHQAPGFQKASAGLRKTESVSI